MRRTVVWIDCEEVDESKVRSKVSTFLGELGVRYTMEQVSYEVSEDESK